MQPSHDVSYIPLNVWTEGNFNWTAPSYDKESWLTNVSSSSGKDSYNPHSYHSIRRQHPVGSVRTNGIHAATGEITFWSLMKGGLAGSYGPDFRKAVPDSYAYVYNKAVGKLYSNIRNSDANLVIDVAEVRQTRRMVANMVKSIASFKKTVLNTISLSNRSKKDLVADKWLEFNLGWKPLINTIHTLATFQHSLMNRYQVKGRGTSVADLDYDSSSHATLTGQSSALRLVEVCMDYTVTDPAALDISRLTSSDPASIAWELTPWSFVVDWFYDIGQYLRVKELSRLSGMEFHRGYVSHLLRNETINIWDGTVYQGYSSWWSSHIYDIFDLHASEVDSEFSRSLLTQPPVALYPRVNVSLGSGQVLTLAALINQLFKK